MRIYEYALGDNIIFFDTHDSACTNKCHRNRYRCRAYIDEQSSEESSQESESEQVKELQSPPEETWEPSGDVDLDLLLTCRQNYNEAVLVPFSANEFGLDIDWFTSYGSTKILFLRDLIPDQSRAISTLHVRGAFRCAPYNFVQQHISALSGLRRLKLIFDVDMTDIRGAPDHLINALEECFDESGVSIFAMAQLQAVDVKMDLTVFYRDVEAVMGQKLELIDWVASKRAFLLTRQSPPRRRVGRSVPHTLRISERIRAQREDAENTAESRESTKAAKSEQSV